jgi:hypothetical protein
MNGAGGAIFYDAAEAAAIVPSYVRYALAAPDELTTEASILLAPPAPFIPPDWHCRPVVAIMPCYTGDLAEGERMVAPLRTLGTQIAEAVAPIPYPALFAMTSAAEARGLRHHTRALFLKSSDEGALVALVEAATAIVSPEALVAMKVAGGAAGRVPAEATAFAHRSTPLWAFAGAAGTDADGDARRQATVDRFWRAMRPYAAGNYVNALGHDEADRTGDAYPPATYARLAELKRRYDPTNLFRHNQNIVPARYQTQEEEEMDHLLRHGQILSAFRCNHV